MIWLRRMVFSFALVGGICFAASAQDQLDREAPNNRSADRPYPNPLPKNLLILQGHKDPRLKILFSAIYSTTNPQCQTRSLPGAIMGAPEVPQTIYDAVRVTRGQSEFSVPVYLDRYLPGRCKWQAISILHSVTDPDLSGQPGHRGLVVIRQNGRRKTALSFICRKWAPHANDDKASIIDCRLERGRDFSLDATNMSPSGGEVDLEYTFKLEAHF